MIIWLLGIVGVVAHLLAASGAPVRSDPTSAGDPEPPQPDSEFVAPVARLPTSSADVLPAARQARYTINFAMHGGGIPSGNWTTTWFAVPGNPN